MRKTGCCASPHERPQIQISSTKTYMFFRRFSFLFFAVLSHPQDWNSHDNCPQQPPTGHFAVLGASQILAERQCTLYARPIASCLAHNITTRPDQTTTHELQSSSLSKAAIRIHDEDARLWHSTFLGIVGLNCLCRRPRKKHLFRVPSGINGTYWCGVVS